MVTSEDLTASKPSKKFAANVLSLGVLLTIFLSSGIFEIEAEVTKDAMWTLTALSLFFNGAKGLQDWQRAKGGQ